MSKWFTKAYWNQPSVPGLVIVFLWAFAILFYIYFPKLLEYLTRPG